MCPTLPQILSWKTGPTGQHLVQRCARMKSLVSCPDMVLINEPQGIQLRPEYRNPPVSLAYLFMCSLPWHPFR